MELGQTRYDMRMKSHHNSTSMYKYLYDGKGNIKTQLMKENTNEMPGAIYIHVPFCKKICSFCTMRRKLGVPQDDYAKLLIRQIEDYSRYPYIESSKYNAVYFGGGTPTTMKCEDLKMVLKALENNLNLTEDVEITIETSITDLTTDKIDMFYDEGVNRFSIGVQTFSDRGRKLLGRIGSGETAKDKIYELKAKGFSNVNIDIIYNYPHQTVDELLVDLDIIDKLDIAGFSLYSLILNDDSNITKRVGDREKFYAINAEKEEIFFKTIVDHLRGKGFEFLELTKLVKDRRDRYQYIKTRYGGGDTLPIGAGAGGNLGDIMYMNPIAIEEYKDLVGRGLNDGVLGTKVNPMYKFIHGIVGQIQMGELNMISFTELNLMYELVEELMLQLVEEGLVTGDRNLYKLTEKGIFWGNNISNEVTDLMLTEISESERA